MLFLVLIASGVLVAQSNAPASAAVSGVVRDAGGEPQIGAVVELLRSDLTFVASAYTNTRGRYSFSHVIPGRYAVKVMGASYLPSLRENVRVQTSAVVNLTLHTLYEAMQWLPAQPRTANEPKDDWTWTLRSAANRPLLRWLEDGPLVVVSEGPHSQPKLKARLVASGSQGTFGEDGRRISAEVEDTPSDSRELLARVDFAPDTDAGMESMLGFRQDLGFAGSVQSVAAVAIHPEVDGGGAEGLDEAAMRTSEDVNFGDEYQLEAGAQQVLARFAADSPNTVAAALPFITIGWHDGNSTVAYRFATSVPDVSSGAESEPATWLPAVAMRNGRLALEHGIHQQIAWQRTTDASGVSIAVYSDSIDNPVLEAVSANGDAPVSAALYDPMSGILRIAAPGYSTTGVVASVRHRLPHGHSIRVSYASGDAMVMPGTPHPTPLALLAAAARPRHAEMYALSLSGTVDGTGTRWRASYRWQPEDTVTRVAPYAEDADSPYLNLHFRQPMCARGEGARSLDAVLDMRNVLAQGRHPFILTDGSLLLFAQDQRALSAGLAFTF
ncbi:MAG TPA: carboxypeptidase-like regulatory domain-containing protein [Terracidiphilus sp.]|nr:carboxypeptidase-like regulatory domain-containing protein [Terracidiphilus sp.]